MSQRFPCGAKTIKVTPKEYELVGAEADALGALMEVYGGAYSETTRAGVSQGDYVVQQCKALPKGVPKSGLLDDFHKRVQQYGSGIDTDMNCYNAVFSASE